MIKELQELMVHVYKWELQQSQSIFWVLYLQWNYKIIKILVEKIVKMHLDL